MLLPGRAPQRFECVTAHVCVYFGKITMGGCVFTLHGKIILLTAWKINGMSLSLPASAVPRGGPHLPHGGALTQPPVSLTLAPVLTWLSPLFHLSFLHYYLSCPLVLLTVFSPLLTEAQCHTICRGMLLCSTLWDEVFYQCCSWHGFWPRLTWLHWSRWQTRTRILKKKKYEHTSWYRMTFLIWTLREINYILV